MRIGSIVRTVAWALLFAALGAAVASWFTARPDLDEQDAIDTAVGALAAAGFEGEVTEPVVRSGHVPDGADPLDVWVVFVDVGDDRIETRVLTDAGQLVYVDDRIGPDRTERLLSDDEFDAVADHRNDATSDEWVGRNAAATVAAALVAGVCFVIAKRSDALWDRASHTTEPGAAG